MRDILSILLLSFCGSFLAQPGTIDPTFNPTDIGFGFGDGANGSVHATSILPDGKIIIAGHFTSYNGTPRNRIACLNVDSTLDISFNIGSGANNMVETIAIQQDGKIIIGGQFTSFNGTPRNRIARLNADGTLDMNFNPGTGANGQVHTTSIQPDGKIVIGGSFNSFDGTPINRITRLNTDGTLDMSFNPGPGPGSPVRTSAMQPDGKIIIGGDFTIYYNTPRNRIARLNADGTLDISFNPGSGANDYVRTLAIQPDGKIIIGGNFTSYNGTVRNRIARLNAVGTLDMSFNPGSGTNYGVLTTAIQPDEKIIIGGSFTSYNGTERNCIARLNADGSLDISFNPGSGANNTVITSAIQPDGKIIIGGGFGSYDSKARNRITRLNTDGTLDISFNPGSGANNWVYSTAIQTDGKIIIGGAFTSYNDTPRNRITRLNATGNLDTSFNLGSGANSSVATLAIQPDGKIIIGGSFTSYNGIERNRIARLNSDGTLDVSFNPGTGADYSVFTTNIQPDGKIIIGGAFTSYDGAPRHFIARLNTDGTLDMSFNPGTGADYTVRTTAIQPDGKIIIGGDFTYYNGIERNRIARLNSDGSLDLSFNPGTGFDGMVTPFEYPIVYTTSIRPDGKIIIGGWFNSYNGMTVNNIACLNADGSLDMSFNIGTGVGGSVSPYDFQTVNTSAIQPDGKIIIGGWFISYNGTPRNNIARLDADGTLDMSFNPGTGANGQVSTTATQPDGKIIIGGWFNSYDGTGRNRIARLNGDLTCQTSFGIDTQVACDSYTWIDGNTYSSNNNSATHILTNVSGCDSLVILDLTIYPTSGTDVQTACESFTWIDGNTYTASNNTATFTLANTAGCDSVVTLNLTINNSSSGSDVQTACESFTWIDGNTYTASNNTATFTLTNAAGCDSVVTLDLTVNNPTSGTDVQTACESFTWIDGNTYTASNNTATFTLANAAECDSVVTLDLTINNPSSGADVQTACESFTWIDGNSYTASNNTATFTLSNAAGCDSVVTLNLTINSDIDLNLTIDGVTITANNSNASYQWIDCSNNEPIAGETNQSFTATENGSYAVILTENNCSDTTECESILTVNLVEQNSGDKIRIFPNPTQSDYTIDLGSVYSTSKVTIINVLGEQLANFEMNYAQYKNLFLDGPSGIYLILIENNSGKSVHKLVKKI